VEKTRTNAWFEVVIHEGRNRQVRRMFDHVHHSVLKLKRVGYAFLKVGKLAPGDFRPLTATEVERLRGLVSGGPKPRPTPARPAAPRSGTQPRAPKRPKEPRTRTRS
jgi:23S rRNA pseudouridine2605 synthase